MGATQGRHPHRLYAEWRRLQRGAANLPKLRQAGLEDVQLRAAVLALQNGHPYMRLPIQFATSMRQRIIGAGLLSEAELDETIAACEQIARDPETFVLTFVVTQVWGRKPQS